MSTLNELLKVSEKRMKGVHPHLQAKVLKIIEDLYNDGYRFAVHMGVRTFDQQFALYAQGRDPLAMVNEKRRQAGYGPISARENRRKVTSVLTSWHNFGVAVDLVEDASPGPGVKWSWQKIKSFLKIGKYARMYNLTWGGYWKSFKDYPHLQLKMPMSLRDAARIYHSRGLERIWSRV